jgi:hypothetical protein
MCSSSLQTQFDSFAQLGNRRTDYFFRYHSGEFFQVEIRVRKKLSVIVDMVVSSNFTINNIQESYKDKNKVVIQNPRREAIAT